MEDDAKEGLDLGAMKSDELENHSVTVVIEEVTEKDSDDSTHLDSETTVDTESKATLENGTYCFIMYILAT